MSLDVERMRRYQERTAALAELDRRTKADAVARAAGLHCSVCADYPSLERIHRSFADLAEAYGRRLLGRVGRT